MYEALLAHDVIVRYGELWGLPEEIRISVGTQEENGFLIETIIPILSKRGVFRFRREIKCVSLPKK